MYCAPGNHFVAAADVEALLRALVGPGVRLHEGERAEVLRVQAERARELGADGAAQERSRAAGDVRVEPVAGGLLVAG